MGRLSRKRKIKAFDPFSKTGGVVPEDPLVAKRRDAPITARDERKEVSRYLVPTKIIPRAQLYAAEGGGYRGYKRKRSSGPSGAETVAASLKPQGPAMPRVARIEGESMKKYKRRVSTVAKEVMYDRKAMGVTGKQTRKKKQLQHRLDRKAEKALAKEHATALRMLMQGGKAAEDGQKRLDVAEQKLTELDERRTAREAARQESLDILELEAGKRGAKRLRKQGRLGARSDEHREAAEDREMQRFLQRRQAEHRVEHSYKGITDAELEGRLAGRIDPAVAGTVREVVARRKVARDAMNGAAGAMSAPERGHESSAGNGAAGASKNKNKKRKIRQVGMEAPSRPGIGGAGSGADAGPSTEADSAPTRRGGSLVAPSLPASMMATEVPDAGAGRSAEGTGDGELGLAALPGEHAKSLGSGGGMTRAGTASGLWARAQAPPYLAHAKARLLRQAMATAANATRNRRSHGYCYG